MIDSHCHIQVTTKWNGSEGPTRYCISAVTDQDNKELLKLGGEAKVLSLGFGLHPHHADEFSESLLGEVRDCLSATARSFVGEIGLELRPQYCERIPFAQ